MRELMALAIAGARGVIVRDVDDDSVSLRQLLVRGSLARAIETITLAVQQVVPLRQLESEYIAWALAKCDGNKTRAAELLGIDVSTIHRRNKGQGDPS